MLIPPAGPPGCLGTTVQCIPDPHSPDPRSEVPGPNFMSKNNPDGRCRPGRSPAPLPTSGPRRPINHQLLTINYLQYIYLPQNGNDYFHFFIGRAGAVRQCGSHRRPNFARNERSNVSGFRLNPPAPLSAGSPTISSTWPWSLELEVFLDVGAWTLGVLLSGGLTPFLSIRNLLLAM
jgi:hypothetical protein